MHEFYLKLLRYKIPRVSYFSMDIIHHFNDSSHTNYKSFYCFVFIGILAEVVDINIGSGDFLYLATIGLSLPLHQMLFIIQIGAWLGIIYCLVMRKMKKTIAFLPFLSIAYIIVTSYSLLF